MNISFICIENDFLTISQAIHSAELINKHLGIGFEKINLLVKPARKIPGSNSVRQLSFFQKLRKLTIKGLLNSIRYRIYSTIVKYNLKNNLISIKKISGSSFTDLTEILDPGCKHLLFFIYYDEIIKEPVLNQYMALNVHPGFLPEYRGVSPIYWQMKEGQQIGAVTVHRMSNGIDEGDIIAEIPFSINEKKQPFEIDIDNHKNKIIAYALFIATRRIIKFNSNFGFSQSLYSGKPRYFGRPPR